MSNDQKFCLDCKFHLRKFGNPICEHESAPVNEAGKKPTTMTMRAENGLCGMSAKLFESDQ